MDSSFESNLIHTCTITRVSGVQTVNAEHELVEPSTVVIPQVRCMFFQPQTATGGVRMFDSANQAILQPQLLVAPDTPLYEGDVITSTVRGFDKGDYTVMKTYYVYSSIATGEADLHHIKADLEVAVIQ